MPRALIVADPLEGLNLRYDTSLALTETALRRGWEVSFTTPTLFWRGMDGVMADAVPVTDVIWKTSLKAGDRRTEPAASFDVIAMRKDPPVDPHFITCVHLLDDAARYSLVTAHPRALLSFSEKLMAPELLAYGPPTLASQDAERLLSFLSEHRDVVLKPLYRGGGSGIVRLSADNFSARSIISLLIRDLAEPVQMQAFLPSVFEGDIRCVMVGQEIIGAFARIPEARDFRANMAQGGSTKPYELSEREREICAHVGAVMDREGITLAGLDFIGGYLTEVNITSPTGLRRIQEFALEDPSLGLPQDGGTVAYWDALEARLQP
jgi:glutathione synthase